MVGEHGHTLVLAHGSDYCEVDLVWVDDHGSTFACAIKFLSVAHLRLPIIVKHVSLTPKTIYMPWRKHLELRLTNLQPLVPQNILGAGASVRILPEQLRQEVFGFGGYMVGEFQVLLADIGIQLLIILPSEREFATK